MINHEDAQTADASTSESALDFTGRPAFYFTAFAVIVISVLLRLAYLGNVPGLNGDEAIIGKNALAFLHGGTVETTTTSGNLVDIFYLIPAIILHALFAPSTLLLRIPSALCGIAEIPVAYIISRRLFDRRIAIITTLTVACLPAAIAENRPGWEPGQIGLVCEWILYQTLILAKPEPITLRKVIGFFASFLAGVLVQPIAIFMALYGCAVLGYLLLHAYEAGARRDRRLPAALAALAAGLVLMIAHERSNALPWVHQAHVSSSPLFCPILFGRFLTGATSFNNFAGVCGWVNIMTLQSQDLIGIIVLAVIAIGIYDNFAHPALSPLPRVLLAGWLLQVTTAFLVSGTFALHSGEERYSLALLPGTALAIALGLAALSKRLPQVLAGVLCLAPAALALASVIFMYFGPLMGYGPDSQNITWSTGPRDLKESAFRYLASGAKPGGAGIAICSEFWSYLPLTYLASGGHRVSVFKVEDLASPSDNAASQLALKDGRFWICEFVPNGMADKTIAGLRAKGATSEVVNFSDYAGHPIIALIRPHWTGNAPVDLTTLGIPPDPQQRHFK